MRRADIVSIHTPLTSETEGLIGKAQIAQMKPGAILINTSRGPVVDTQALADALNAGQISAGIDVYESDPPLPSGHPLMGAAIWYVPPTWASIPVSLSTGARPWPLTMSPPGWTGNRSARLC